MDKHKKLGIAIVGLGNYGQNYITAALQKTENCFLAGIVTGSPEKAEKYKKEFSIEESCIYDYNNFDEIADNERIDVVYICLPNNMHAEYTIRAARAGKHVICEKPMATTVKDAEQMIKACRNNNVRLLIGYRLHFEPFNLEIRKYAREKPFGKVRSIDTANAFDTKGWRLDKEFAGGGPLMDAGIYCVQAARYATGMEPLAVTAKWTVPENDDKYRGIESEISWTFDFPDGIDACCYSSYEGNQDFLKVNYENGWARLDNAYSYDNKRGETSKGKLEYQDEFEQVTQLDQMSSEILNNEISTASGEEGLQDMRILEAIYKAAATGEKVSIGEQVPSGIET